MQSSDSRRLRELPLCGLDGDHGLTILSPYPPYKPSGIEWLDHVTEHWGIAAVKAKLRNSTWENASKWTKDSR